MTDEQAESLRIALIAVLTKAHDLLAHHSVQHWPAVLERARHLIEDRDITGVERLISIFGSMGSFNDVIIHPLNGDHIDLADVDSVNKTLHALATEIHDLAEALCRYGNANEF